MDDRDRFRFIHDLFEFNDTKRTTTNHYYFSKSLDVRRREIKKLARKLLVEIHAFVMMPNHYHLLLSSRIEHGIPLFMKKLNGGYAKYFNEKYKRSGALFQGKYKSVPIESDPHFSWIPYYIHFNPLDLHSPEWRKHEIKDYKKAMEHLKTYRWSSHLDYLGIKNFPSLTQREYLRGFWGNEKEYEKSVKRMLEQLSADILGKATLE